MKKRDWPLLIVIALFLLGGGAFFYFVKVSAVCLVNPESAKRTLIKIAPSEEFSLFYTHSIYDAPVLEEFRAGRDEMILIGVRTNHAGVKEYYGFERSEEFHFIKRTFKNPIVIKIGAGEGQGIEAGGRRLFLREIGQKGDRIELSIREYSLASFIILNAFQ